MKPTFFTLLMLVFVLVLIYSSKHALILAFLLMAVSTGIELIRVKTMKRRKMNCDLVIFYRQENRKYWIVFASIIILLLLVFANKKMLPELMLIMMPLLTTIFLSNSKAIGFGLNNDLLTQNGLFLKEYNLSTLTSISFIALGDFLKLKFKEGKTAYIPRSAFEREKLQEFMTVLLQSSPQEVVISAEAKEKLSLD